MLTPLGHGVTSRAGVDAPALLASEKKPSDLDQTETRRKFSAWKLPSPLTRGVTGAKRSAAAAAAAADAAGEHFWQCS